MKVETKAREFPRTRGAEGEVPRQSAVQACVRGADAGSAKAMRTACKANVVDKNGKKLSRAAKTSFLKKCEAG